MADKHPAVNGVEYPEKPDGDASATEIMEYMEKVDMYWQEVGFQDIESDDEESDF